MRPSRRKPASPANDPLVESLLEEVLGGTRPPDLREQILLSSETVGRETAQPAHPPSLPGLMAPPVQDAEDRPHVELVFRSEAGGRRARQRRFRRLASLIVQSVVLLAGVVLALAALPHVVAWRANDAEEVTLANSSPGDSSARDGCEHFDIRDEHGTDLRPRAAGWVAFPRRFGSFPTGRRFASDATRRCE